MSGYADTSFLVSIYTLDSNSPAAIAAMRTGALPLLLTPLGENELVNTIYLRVFRRELQMTQAHSALGIFRNDVSDGMFQRKPLIPAVLEKAQLLSRKQTPRLGTRGINVLHVASALVWGASEMYTFDKTQRKLAEAEGLRVVPR